MHLLIKKIFYGGLMPMIHWGVIAIENWMAQRVKREVGHWLRYQLDLMYKIDVSLYSLDRLPHVLSYHHRCVMLIHVFENPLLLFFYNTTYPICKFIGIWMKLYCTLVGDDIQRKWIFQCNEKLLLLINKIFVNY